jgi:hypothetical protein
MRFLLIPLLTLVANGADYQLKATPGTVVWGFRPSSGVCPAGIHAYVTGIFRESSEKSSRRLSKMYKLQGPASRPVHLRIMLSLYNH